MSQPKTALVLAGGGSHGAIVVGMLREVIRAGVQPDFVIGASAGAINAAYFCGHPTAEGVTRLEQIWCRLNTNHVFGPRWHSFVSVLRRRDYLFAAQRLRGLLEMHIAYRDLAHAHLPLHVVASDQITGEEVVLSSGPAIEAVLASTAIPGIFPAVSLNGRELVDGGVSSNTPIAAAIRLGARRLIVLPTGFACAQKRVPQGVIGRTMHALSLLVARQLVADLDRWGNEAEIVVAPPLCPLEVSSYDYSRGAELIERAAVSTRAWIAAGGLHRPGVPHQLKIHAHKALVAL